MVGFLFDSPSRKAFGAVFLRKHGPASLPYGLNSGAVKSIKKTSPACEWADSAQRKTGTNNTWPVIPTPRRAPTETISGYATTTSTADLVIYDNLLLRTSLNLAQKLSEITRQRVTLQNQSSNVNDYGSALEYVSDKKCLWHNVQ